MADREVRSPHSRTNDQSHPRLGETASMHGGPFVDRRADQGTPAKPQVQGQPLGVIQDKGRR